MKPPTFAFRSSTVDAISSYFGAESETWVARQTQCINQFLGERSLFVTEYVDGGLATNEICFVEGAGQNHVLKTGYPNPELWTEIDTLRLWRGRKNCVQLVDVDDKNGILLLERIMPGTTFRSEAVSRRSRLVPDLFLDTVIEQDLDLFPSYHTWVTNAFGAYRENSSTVLGDSVDVADQLFSELWRDHAERYVLHGDLHHENMLRNHDGSWTAIDPKGIAGPLILNYGRFMHNFAKDEPLSIDQMIRQRAKALEGRFSAEELMIAGFVDLVLSCSWCVNEGMDMTHLRQDLVPEYRRLVALL